MKLSVALWWGLAWGTCAMAPDAQAWSNHTVGSYLALQALPQLRDAPEVEVEALEPFLVQEHAGLVVLLERQEQFAREHFAHYPPRPDELKLGEPPGDNPRQAFLQALRLNPKIHLALAIQPMAGQDQPRRQHLAADQVMVEQTLSPWNTQRFIALAPAERVAPLAVLASAADEPDYGHDINLFSDNPGDVGARYGFGPQPFGDARFQYSSQAPFHMGFFHENPVVYAAAPFLQRNWPHWRAYQFLDLARFAFAKGHPYWGYRFLGWGLHYIQDLTQPYHATALPGVDLADMLLMESKALAGYDADKKAAIERAATRHTEVEKYQFNWLHGLLLAGQPHPILAAYADTERDASYPPYSVDYPREVISAESSAQAAAFDEAIGQWLQTPAANQSFSAGNALAREPHEHAALNGQLLQLIRNLGAHSRNFVRAGIQADAGPGTE